LASKIPDAIQRTMMLQGQCAVAEIVPFLPGLKPANRKRSMNPSSLRAASR
jgi:hypothetical protein